MFQPNIRSSSGLLQTKSLVLCVYWDPNMFDICASILESQYTYSTNYIVRRRPEDDLMLGRNM